MIKQYSLIIIALFTMGIVRLQAQQLPVMNHYIYNPYLYNPARTAQKDGGRAFMHFKKQWVNMPNSPITGALSGEFRLPNKDMGVGMLFYFDRMHIIDRIGGLASYAYHIPFSKTIEHRLSFGLSVGFIHQKFNFTQATVKDENDQQFLATDANGTTLDFSAGVNYNYKKFNVGFGVMQGLGNDLRFLSGGDNVSFLNARHLLANASYEFELGAEKKFSLEPSVLARFVPNLPMQIEANVLAGWKKQFFVGAGYRSSNNANYTSAILATAAININENIFLAYTAEFSLEPQVASSLGTQHEVTLGVKFGNGQRLKKLEEEMAAAKAMNQEQELKIGAQDDKQTAMEGRMDSLNQELNAMGADRDRLLKELEEQRELLRSHEKAIEKNRKDIDELRKLLQAEPFRYKKIGDVEFSQGAAKLSKEAKAKLDALKGELAKLPATTTLYLYGNASTEGNADANMRLSTRRTIAVRKYLIQQGAKVEIIVLPMGEENPNKATSSVNGKDRRVDLIISKD